ncbi:hypothetical protein AcV7_000515 [Taiwanofungus camphoratus]|nr:hypothetical protein AcV7_000515 [Antrodia cinnamomea]
MSSFAPYSRRHRSHSASSPIRASHLSDDPKWRLATKRARPDIASRVPLEKWDVDLWRRGKRARRDTAARDTPGKRAVLPTESVFLEERSSSISYSSMPGLPCTSDAFDLFPKHREDRRTSHRVPGQLDPVPSPDDEIVSVEEINRSDAFWELRRSVAESGEGLILRMRDWERSRSRSSASPNRSRSREQQPKRRRRSARYSHGHSGGGGYSPRPEQDDEDVEIVSTEAPSGSSHSHFRSASHSKKRAMSMGTMDIDLPAIEVHTSLFTNTEGSERCSSPINGSAGISAYSSDDEYGHLECDAVSPLSGPPSAMPTLSHSYTNSTNSSIVSLPLSLSVDQAQEPPLNASPPVTFPNGMQQGRKSLHVPSSASRSEKALVALTLAMANGAGGLNDYGALRVADGTSANEPTIDECQVGELWH